MIELNAVHKLEKKVKWRALTSIILIFALISLPFVFGGIKMWWGVFIVLFIFIGMPLFIYLFLYYSSCSYIIEDNKLTINKGIAIKSSKSIPYQQVQNIQNVNGIVDRWFNLTIVKIWTASPSQIDRKETSPDGTLELLNTDAAWLKDFILSKQNK